jgi:hypothetical protein
MTEQLSSKKTHIDRLRAEALLFPIAAFLYAGGWSKKDAALSFSRAFEHSQDKQGARQLRHIGDPLHMLTLLRYGYVAAVSLIDPGILGSFRCKAASVSRR